MKTKSSFLLIPFCALLLGIAGCSKSYNYPATPLTDYMPLNVGKFIVYRLDSLIFINFGTTDTVFSYLAKDIIEDSITDNEGRPSLRVVRYISDTTGLLPWTPIETYMVTPTRNNIQVVENNLRFIKLVEPFVNAYTWQGNSYIDTRSAFSDFAYMDGWNYYYDSLSMPYSLPGQVVSNALIVQQDNDSSGSVADNVFSTRTYSQEVYGRGIGLIYKNFLHWEYQPPNVNVPVGSYAGYGLKLTMVDHN
jgi:hypothetical protein